MNKILFWVLWVFEILAFIFLGGCFVLLMTMNGGSVDIEKIIVWGLIGAAFVVSMFGLIRAFVEFRAGVPASRVVLYLALPPLAAFVAFGSCMIILR